MSEGGISIQMVLDSGELEAISFEDINVNKTYIIKSPLDETIYIVKGSGVRATFMASRITNRIQHEQKGLRYRIRVVEQDERQLFIDSLAQKPIASPSEVEKVQVDIPTFETGSPTTLPPEEMPSFVKLETEQEQPEPSTGMSSMTELVTPKRKAPPQVEKEPVAPPPRLDADTYSFIRHLCGSMLLGTSMDSLRNASVGVSLTDDQKQIIRNDVLEKIDNFLNNL